MSSGTRSFIGLQAGLYTGIIPSQAQAHVRVGFLPDGDDPAAVVADLRRLAGREQVELTVVGRPGDTVTRMHGTDERVRTQALRPGTDLVHRVLSRLRVD